MLWYSSSSCLLQLCGRCAQSTCEKLQTVSTSYNCLSLISFKLKVLDTVETNIRLYILCLVIFFQIVRMLVQHLFVGDTSNFCTFCFTVLYHQSTTLLSSAAPWLCSPYLWGYLRQAQRLVPLFALRQIILLSHLNLSCVRVSCFCEKGEWFVVSRWDTVDQLWCHREISLVGSNSFSTPLVY